MDSNENENMIVSKNENGLYLNEIIIEKNVEIYRNVSFQIVNNSTWKGHNKYALCWAFYYVNDGASP
jgi:hypothetical protein